MNKETIRDFYGKVIGYIETDDKGDKTIRNFYGQIKGYYKKNRNVTTDFYGRVLYQGDNSSALLRN